MKIPLPLSLCLLGFLALPAMASTLAVDKTRSRIQVDAKATGHFFTGSLTDYKVTATGDENGNKPTSFDLSWDFNDLQTGDVKRDSEMISWLGGGKPKGTFKFIKSWQDETGNPRGQGELTIHGVSKTITFPYTVSRNGDWVTIDGKAYLDYRNFQLPLIRSMAVMTVNPALLVRFHVVGKVK